MFNRKLVNTNLKLTIGISAIGLTLLTMLSCNQPNNTSKSGANVDLHQKLEAPITHSVHHSVGNGKPIIYQVFTRLFGNTNTTNKPWGTIAENGVGKFSDFDDTALLGIKELGTSYIWYTGVPHHALINDYSKYGISADDPDVVKGRAGSPYAVKDYYNVNPDLADNPENRLAEFEALIQRTHKHDMKVIIDIVPNHVARHYESLSLPEGEVNFGANDNTELEYHKHNNFYYIVGQSFEVPDKSEAYLPLGGENHPLSDGKFIEVPAKWTGNGSREPKPNANDWYETVKVNYGVRPDGNYDFPTLPEEFREQDVSAHYEFWQKQQDLPDSWLKFEAIVHYWLSKGVDGFRYDMAEMVPYEFWSFLNSSIKHVRPDALLLAEVYNPSLYRDYIKMGKMDYLYDKVEFYDSLKRLMQGKGPSQTLEDIQHNLQDIEHHMLHFLENHDEQRIASNEFAGDAKKGKPAMVVSALISRSPTMLYFAQDVGEDGSEDTGFGDPTRTTIFDYAGVPAHQRWMNDGKFDGAKLSKQERELRGFYVDLMRISATHPSMRGDYVSLHSFNTSLDKGYTEQQHAFVRFAAGSALIVVANFSDTDKQFDLVLPQTVVERLKLGQADVPIQDLLSKNASVISKVGQETRISINMAALESLVYEVKIGS